jgi:formylmethanofuran dehydrogenase subunit B
MAKLAAPPAVCPHCGCRCDVISLSDGCGLGRAAPPADAPVALIDGRPAGFDEALDRAAELLSAGRYPLVYGLAHLTCDAQRAAISLADRLGAAIDIAGAGPAPLFPDLGSVTCSLGELKNRADLIVFWGGQPHETHSRLARDFAVDPVGRFVPAGRLGRTVIVIGNRAVADGYTADLFLPATAGEDFAALWLLRALVQGKPVDPELGPVAGITLAEWKELAERFQRCKFGVLFFSATAPTSRRAPEAAHGLATDLNAFTRFYALKLPPPGNLHGAEQVLAWQTGYPAAVAMHGGFPRSFGDEYSAERLLTRGETDALLLAGAGGLEELPPQAQKHLRQIPIVAIAPQIAALPVPAAVAITTVACANPSGATAFRFDRLALPLRPAISSSFPDEFQVLQRIEQTLRRTAARG